MDKRTERHIFYKGTPKMMLGAKLIYKPFLIKNPENCKDEVLMIVEYEGETCCIIHDLHTYNHEELVEMTKLKQGLTISRVVLEGMERHPWAYVTRFYQSVDTESNTILTKDDVEFFMKHQKY